MQWTDRIRQVKILLVVMAIIIAVVSLLVSHFLVDDLSAEERKKMEVWAQALHSLNEADESTDLSLVLSVMEGNSTIPVIVLDKDGHVADYRNIKIKAADAADTIAFVERMGQRMKAADRYIKIQIGDSTDYQLVCYDDSVMLKRLAAWPYVQLGIVLIFVWVGLSKETAHQLGTPISSLMAWTEMLKENYPNDELLPEMDKDVKRLERIAERFSKIGSVPEPVDTSMKEVLQHVIEYMSHRTSQKVQIVSKMPQDDVVIKINASLFEWVIENLCKNAVDAMEGEGTIEISLWQTDNRVVIEVSDTGKGIRKKDIKNVFTPGFTTKKRGWGLGLSLAKRIVEEYHHGHIFVKWSELGKGTTFRIEMPQ